MSLSADIRQGISKPYRFHGVGGSSPSPATKQATHINDLNIKSVFSLFVFAMPARVSEIRGHVQEISAPTQPVKAAGARAFGCGAVMCRSIGATAGRAPMKNLSPPWDR